MKQSINVLLSGGGTGGHIYPAIAIANEIKTRFPNAKFLFVGAKGRMEMEKVPQNGYEIRGLWISGIQRSLTLQNLSFPFKLVSSLWNARKIVRKFKPTVVIGTGGFASGPTLFMANKRNIPTVIQEQNSYPGITNKLLAKKARKICVAYDKLQRYFPEEKIIKTGNPVREDLLNNKNSSSNSFGLDKSKRTLLVLGGSLGARRINQLIEEQLDVFIGNNVQVIWQTGKLYFKDYKKYNNSSGIQVHSFLNNMNEAYTSADFIISRAGASSISELCIVGKPTIFIPSPNVAENHQVKNALAIVENDGAIMIEEKNLGSFEKIFLALIGDEKLQKKLSDNIKSMALPNATKDIVDQILELIRE